jgi:urease accessory protein
MGAEERLFGAVGGEGMMNGVAPGPVHPSSSFPSPFKGRLRLRFEYDQQAKLTRLTACEQQPPLKAVRAFHSQDGSALVHIHNVSGGVLGGDSLNLTVDVGPEAQAQLTSTGATRIYRSRPNTPIAVQLNEIRVGENALLEFLPDTLIPFKGSSYCQKSAIELAEGAGLFWWETVAPGRAACGEVFAFESLQFKLDITTAEKPLAQERIKLDPAGSPLESPLRLGPFRYFSTLYICRVGLEAGRWLALERQLAELALQLSSSREILWGVSTLTAHGLVVRGLSVRGGSITRGLLAFWHAAKLELYGRGAIPPRKVP